MSKRLLVLRHAKAVTQLGLADHERPLAERGVRDSTAMGEFLRSEGLVPDLVLCSTALRTRQTLDGLGLEGVDVSFERGIYLGDGYDLLTQVQITDENIESVLVIGHNPACHELVIMAGGEVVEEFPTCALGVIELEDWNASTGRLLTYRTPKMLR